MFSAVTRDILVEVRPSYMPQDSNPDEHRFVWAYHVTIRNAGKMSVRLLSRRWLITDSAGVCGEVRGMGVVGQQPTILPGDAVEYTSCCPLSTSSGIMIGTYRMLAENGETFEVQIPAFSLDIPDESRVLN